MLLKEKTKVHGCHFFSGEIWKPGSRKSRGVNKKSGEGEGSREICLVGQNLFVFPAIICVISLQILALA